MVFPSPGRLAGRVAAVLSLGAALAAIPIELAFAQEIRRLAVHDTIEISRCEDFAAATAFVPGRRIGERVLGSIGFNFASLFLDETETDGPVFMLQAWTLRYSADDLSLISQLGGEGRALVPLCSIHRLIEMGSRGGSHTDGQSNFAFARSSAGGRLMAIHWFVNHGNEWVIGAVDVPHPQLDLPPGARVFSQAIVKAEDTR